MNEDLRAMKRVGLLAAFCGVCMGGMPPATTEIIDEADMTEPFANTDEWPAEQTVQIDESWRRLSANDTNTTGDGLEAGAVVAIVLGSVAAAMLLLFAIYWAWSMSKSKGGYAQMNRGQGGFVNNPSNPPFQNFGFSAPAGGDDQTEMPLLRLASTNQGAAAVATCA